MSISSTSPLAQTFEEWRLMWRTRGLAVDRLLPDAFTAPALSDEALQSRVAATVQVPGRPGRTKLTQEDKTCVMDVASFATGFVAELLPAQVLLTDAKSVLPHAASKLAVASVGGETEFLGSFDLVVRIRSGLSKGPWRSWDGKDGVIDLKVTGASEPFGLNSTSMRRWLMHGRLVLQAARKDKHSPVGACSFAAYLIRRPEGALFKSRGGKYHGGAYGFAAYDVQALISWSPDTSAAPKPFLVLGNQLIAGKSEETAALASQVLPPPMRPAQVNRWDVLRDQKGVAGWCTLHDFVELFKLKGRGDVKYAANRVAKRLRDANCVLQNRHAGVGKSRPFKKARICDLKRVYKEHQY